MRARRVLALGIGSGVASFVLFLLITLVMLRSQIVNLSFLFLDTRCEVKSVKKALQTFSETGHFPQSIESDLELYATALCSYYGKDSSTYEQKFISHDPVKALKLLRLLIKNHPRSFVVDRSAFAVIVYTDVLMRLEREPNILQDLECDKETLQMEYEAQLSIANGCGTFLVYSADSAFIDGDYKRAFHYFRRQGLSEGLIYCHEYGIGTAPLPKMIIWALKGVGWLLGDFDSYNYWLLKSEYNSILEERKRNRDRKGFNHITQYKCERECRSGVGYTHCWVATMDSVSQNIS